MVPPVWRCRDRVVDYCDHPLIMGIVNVTPDSFSDGGRYQDSGQAIDHGRQLLAEGADILDIGGESTRPGAAPVPLDEELRRVMPVISALAPAGAVLSIDTRKAAVARAALEAGAHIVNDVSALGHDPAMMDVVRATGAGAILMHMRGEPGTMQNDPKYDDVVAEVHAYLVDRVAACQKAGIAADRLAVDPGMGFGKTAAHNVALLVALQAVAIAGYPLVVGLSRKRFIGMITGRSVDLRLAGTLAATVVGVQHGAHIVRVHDVAETRDVLAVLAALIEAGGRA